MKSDNLIKNIFITGKPGGGKTSLIMEVIKEIPLKAKGFYTQEIRNERGKRIGFRIASLSGKVGILASVNIISDFSVGKYKVNIKDLEEIGVESILEGLNDSNNLIVIDEVGKMELFSEKFRKVVEQALNSKNKVLATLKVGLISSIKDRRDTLVLNLVPDNKEEIKQTLLDFLKKWGYIRFDN